MFPFEEFDKFFEDMMPSRKGMSNFMPAVDIYEDKKNVIVEMTVAHIDPEKFDIKIEDNVLYVKGSTEKKSEFEEKNYYRREISVGSFHRSIPLPKSVIGEKASAVHENGVLKISMPIKSESNKKTIKVQVKKSAGKKKSK